MTKTEAVGMFGGTQASLARALKMTRAAISRWPDTLTESQVDRVLGAAIRCGKSIPEPFRVPRGVDQQAASIGNRRQMG